MHPMLAVQALTILLGIFAFGTPLTPDLALGVGVTLLTSALYAWLRTSKVLETTHIVGVASENVELSLDEQGRPAPGLPLALTAAQLEYEMTFHTFSN